MTLGAKILTALAVLCFLLWGAAFALDVRPLLPAPDVRIVYGVHEDFHSDGMAFRGLRNAAFFIVHLPQAAPGHRWWTIDFRDLSIAMSGPVRSLGTERRVHYALKGDLDGASIGADEHRGAWTWRFSGDSASFAGQGLSCRVTVQGSE
jgi:hypothetical protein